MRPRTQSKDTRKPNLQSGITIYIIRIFRSIFIANKNLHEVMPPLTVTPATRLVALTGVTAMRLSTKSRFAVTAMIDVALRERSGPVPLSDIAVRHQISLSYLEQLFSKLRQQGLVESTRGPGGGYTLGHRSDSITVADIIGAVEAHADSSSREVPSQETTVVRDMTQELTQELWDTLNSKMTTYMQSITLRSLVMTQLAKGVEVKERKVANRGVFKKPRVAPVRTTAPNSVFALAQSLLLRG
jgi:Rrf2 family iron-sulfur cluster assembly transcriptional regulator